MNSTARIGMAVVICFTIVLLVGCKPGAISSAEIIVSQSLKDPDSAKFSNEFVQPDGTVCGMVNAKNSYGAYTGPKLFSVNNGVVRMENSSSDALVYNVALRADCAK